MTSSLNIALEAARAGGRILHEMFDASREIRSKGKRDIVTDADFASERTVREILHHGIPQAHFISEESDAATRERLWAELTADSTACAWIVDPLDGTTNYAHHQPIFNVSIAFFCGGMVQTGVVYDPMQDEVFAAERGKGATLNGAPIAVSVTNDFDDAVLGVDWGRAQAGRDRTGELLVRMLKRVDTSREFGSAALSLCYVAAGRLDAYFHLTLSPWDVAAASLIVEEAGGKVTNPSGSAWTVHSESFVASNSRLHPTLLEFFQ